MPAMSWKFVEDDPDGAVWLAAPDKVLTFVDATDPEDGRTYRIMVVTRAFVQRSMAEAAPHGAVMFAPMVVLPDGSRTQLLEHLQAAMSNSGVTMFGIPVEDDDGSKGQ